MKRRDFLKAAGTVGVGMVLMPSGFKRKGLQAVPAAVGLSETTEMTTWLVERGGTE